MKKHLLCIAALAAAGAASAQSSVTLYGNVMLGAVKETGKANRLDAGNGGSYVGFRGAEDLGAGDLKAIFDLQMRFSPESGGNDGSANGRPLFQGQTIAGLSSATYGTLTLGRAKTPLQSMIDSGTPFLVVFQGSQDILGSGYATDPRLASGARGGLNVGDDAGSQRTDHVAYATPRIAGFGARLGYGFKNSAADGNTTADAQDTKSLISVRADYSAGPAFAAIGYERNRENDKITAITGSYDFQVAKLWLGHSNSKIDTTNTARTFVASNPNGTIGFNTALPKRNVTTAAVSAPLGAFTPMLGYARIKASGTAADEKANKISVGSTYTLSKRTFLYATYFDQKKKTTAGDTKIKGADLGLSHAF